MDLSNIKLGDTVYSLKDTSARQQISKCYTKSEVDALLSTKADISIPDIPWIIPTADGITATSRAMVNFGNKTLLLHAQITFNLSSVLASGTAVLKFADDVTPKPVEFVQWCPVVKGTVAHTGLYHRANHTFTTLSDLPVGETVIQLMVLVNTAT